MAGELGVVVVGMGIAGKVRVRDIKKCAESEDYKNTDYSRLTLKGYVSRREHNIDGASPITLAEALDRDDVHIIIITTENCTHFDIAKQALQAGKHVLIEYPLALSLDEGQQLYKLAQEKGVILYEENISILQKSFLNLKELVTESQPTRKCQIKLVSGQVSDWKSDISKAGQPFICQIALLHNIVILYGEDILPAEAVVEWSEGKIFCEGVLKSKDGKRSMSVIVDRSGAQGSRKTTFEATLEDSTSINVDIVSAPSERGTLFLDDLKQFVDVVAGKRENTILRTLRCLELADKLGKLARNNPQSVSFK